MSLSYLSSKLMEVAGLPKTAYMNFLQDTEKHLPMLNPYAYMGTDKVWHTREETTNASTYLNRYWTVQHYMMFDRPKDEP